MGEAPVGTRYYPVCPLLRPAPVMSYQISTVSLLILTSPLPNLSQYQVTRTDPLATLTKALKVFSLEAADGSTASLRCPDDTKVLKSVNYQSVSHLISSLEWCSRIIFSALLKEHQYCFVNRRSEVNLNLRISFELSVQYWIVSVHSLVGFGLKRTSLPSPPTHLNARPLSCIVRLGRQMFILRISLINLVKQD